jgi:1,4-alpha-glucan branching enzyme
LRQITFKKWKLTNMSTAKRSAKKLEPERSASPARKGSAKRSVVSLKSAAPKSSAPFPTVRLELYAPGAQRVFVAGSFNQWEPSATALYAAEPGHWARELALAPGQYEYLFLADGQWQPDPKARDYAPNPFGGLNCVLDIRA